jgi:hypothetical protein
VRKELKKETNLIALAGGRFVSSVMLTFHMEGVLC